MDSQADDATDCLPTSVGRYRVEELLGRGGMACVYRAYDEQRGGDVALKRLLRRDVGAEHVARLFELEYHTLSQLAHPGIVEAYDYHTDASGPFYTMELLTGGDLRQRAPLAWSELCHVLCDVCSGLALLHSRRLVHRDLTPLNVRCTAAGQAKLFDFGSMTPFGRPKSIVGTPPFVAPEALNGEAIDGRVDLFALGATAYYALTGRHAYPARELAELPDLWLSAPAAPSSWVSDLPPALDDLIMALLNLSPHARPPTAAEVMERLSAIAGFEPQEATLVSHGYLATPMLVGREFQVATLTEKLARLSQGQGATILVRGAAGSGRSRLLDAYALEAKLSGALVLRTDARGAASERWSAGARLLADLSQQLPAWSEPLLARHELSALVSSYTRKPLRSVAPPAPREQESGTAHRAAIHAAFRDALVEIAQRNKLVLVVDDLDSIDEPSAALFALLASQAREHPWLLLASDRDEVVSDAAKQRALQLLASEALTLRLHNLGAEDADQLVVSLFNAAPNARVVADRIFAATHGNPRLIMRVAYHLVQTGVCKYARGTWTLPASLATETLVEASHSLSTKGLSVAALELARSLALARLATVSWAEALVLSGHQDLKQLQSDLHALALAELVTFDEDEVSLSTFSWQQPLLANLTPDHLRALHLRVAEVLAGHSGDGPYFRRLQHLLRAGDCDSALSLLRDDLRVHRKPRAQDPNASFEYIQALPSGWTDTYRELIEHCRRSQQPRRDRLELQLALLGYATLSARTERAYLIEIAAQLRSDAGLDLIEALRGRVPAEELLGQALGAASRRYDETPEAERGLPLVEALTELGQLIVQAIGMCGRAFDLALLQAMPSLADVAALSPALAAVQKNLENSIAVLAGRAPEAHDAFLELAQRLEQPDGAGLSPTHRQHMRCAVLWIAGVIEAEHGQPRALVRADAIADNPLFAVSALKLRALYALTRGDGVTAARLRLQTDLLQIQNCPPQLFQGAEALRWTFAYALLGDMLHVKQCVVELEDMARDHAAWQPVANCGRGLYQMLRGDYAHAQRELEQGLTRMQAGGHIAWSLCAGTLLWALNQQGRYTEAQARGVQLLSEFEAAGLIGAAHLLLVPLAMAEARVGPIERAVERVQRAIDWLSAHDGASILLGQAYEVRAYVALEQHDAAAFQYYAAACETQYQPAANGPLLIRLKKLDQAAHAAALWQDASAAHTSNTANILDLMTSANGARERAERALVLLADATGSVAGFLYLVESTGLALAAQLGTLQVWPDLQARVVNFFTAARMDSAQTQTIANSERDTPATCWVVDDELQYLPILLSHETPGGLCVNGVALLSVERNRPAQIPARLLHALSKALRDTDDRPEETGEPTRPMV
ncbi:MAG: hypothetical protein RL701_7658 [Pseudomonadota bacterium]